MARELKTIVEELARAHKKREYYAGLLVELNSFENGVYVTCQSPGGPTFKLENGWIQDTVSRYVAHLKTYCTNLETELKEILTTNATTEL